MFGRRILTGILRAIGFPVVDATEPRRSPSEPEPPPLHHNGCGCDMTRVGWGSTSSAVPDGYPPDERRQDAAGIESDAPVTALASTDQTPLQRAYVAFQSISRQRTEAGHLLNAEIARAGAETGMRPVVVDDVEPSARYGSGSGSRAPAAIPLVGGRLTVNSPSTIFKGTKTIMPPPDHTGKWRMEELDNQTLDKRSPAEILELLANLSPEVSRALWDFLRLTNAGYEYRALKVGTETEDKRAKKLISEFMDVLKNEHGSVDVVINRLFIGAFMRGALFGELVLDADARTPIDIATPDPATVRFRLQDDPVRGQVWELGQWQAKEFVPLDRITVKYIPIDPFPGNPYGRPLVAPALFSTLFLVGLLHDLRRVISQQGYPRIDVVVMIDKIMARMPPEDRNDQEEVEKWISEAVKDIRTVYKNLAPDDALVHDDGVEVKGAVGTVDSSSLGSVDGVISMLERMAVRALKSMPLMMGITDGVSEANANRQWEIFAAGIKSIQHHAETLLERLLELALQAQGVVVDVEFRFSENRSAEELRDQQTLAAKIENYARMRNEGWIDQDEASNKVTGHDADSDPPALNQPAPANGDAVTDQNPEPGSARRPRIRTLNDDVDAFRTHMQGQGFVRTTMHLPAGRRPSLSPGETTMPTGAVQHVDGVRYDEWDVYGRADPVLPAGQPEGTVPASVNVDSTDNDGAVALFDRNMADYAGVLDAKVETNGTNGTS